MRFIGKIGASLTAGVLACILYNGSISPAWSEAEQQGPRFGEPFPVVNIPASAKENARSARSSGPSSRRTELSGQEAVDALGVQLRAVARWYGLSEQKLRTELLHDENLKIDEKGRLYFVEPVEPADVSAKQKALPAQRSAVDHSQQRTAGNPLWNSPAAIAEAQFAPLNQTFTLNSRPGASKTIFLNFFGARLANTAWNYGSTPVINAPAFSFEGPGFFFDASRNWRDPQVIKSYYSDRELRVIQRIWQIVSQDYAAFDVNVTTEPVPVDRLQRSTSSDQVYGATLLFTNNYGTFNYWNAAGVAYLWGIGDLFLSPALVFIEERARYAWNDDMLATAVANTASHEAGHNLGIFHDGWYDRVTKQFDPYYDGHGPFAYYPDGISDPFYLPMMAAGGWVTFKQWSKGEYPNAIVQDEYGRPSEKKQDDLAEIKAYLGLRPDEAGDTIRAAAQLPVTSSNGSTTAKVTGLIGIDGDSDVYSFRAGPGPLLATAYPPWTRANPDLELTLLSESGEVIATDNPRPTSSATVKFRISREGTYFLRVKGAGLAAVPGHPGYSAYGSLGFYTLTLAQGKGVKLGVPPVAKLSVSPSGGVAPQTISLDSRASTDDGEVTSVRWFFGDGGTDVSGNLRFTSRTYTQPNTYPITIEVTDDEGLTSQASFFLTLTAPVKPPPPPVNNPPVADLKVTPASGPAPLTVSLDASGSRDDGRVASYKWTFEDGSTSTVTDSRVITRRIGTPGTYQVSVMVQDDKGLTNTATKRITVTAVSPPPPPPPPPVAGGELRPELDLKTLAMSRTLSAVTGTLFVRDATGKALANAVVNYRWSGLVQGDRSTTSRTAGTTVQSLPTSKKGCFVLTVTGITLNGYSYDKAKPKRFDRCL